MAYISQDSLRIPNTIHQLTGCLAFFSPALLTPASNTYTFTVIDGISQMEEFCSNGNSFFQGDLTVILRLPNPDTLEFNLGTNRELTLTIQEDDDG